VSQLGPGVQLPLARALRCIAQAAPMASAAALVQPEPMAQRHVMPPESYNNVSERRKLRKVRRRRGPAGVGVIEAARGADEADQGDAATGAEARESAHKRPAVVDNEELKRRRTYRRLGVKGDADHEENEDAAFERLPVGFAQDFFSCPTNAKPVAPCLARIAAIEPPEVCAATPPSQVDQQAWLQMLQLGFSVLVQGVGSKYTLLERFADTVLRPWGATIVRLCAFDARVSLPECLRDILEQLHPDVARAGPSVEALSSAIVAARRAARDAMRPLCFVVHNLECLPPQHQTVLASMAAARGVHLVASVDNIWAPVAWSPKVLKDFNFCRDEVHTFDSYEVENVSRFPNGLPGWCDPCAAKYKARKTSLALVLKSLTRSHRELVQVIAEHQLEAGGRTGISQSRLLSEATDRMIASTTTVLKGLLNELRDHEVVALRGAADGGTLLYLTCDAKVLARLANGQEPEESEEESEHDVA